MAKKVVEGEVLEIDEKRVVIKTPLAEGSDERMAQTKDIIRRLEESQSNANTHARDGWVVDFQA